MGMIHIFERGDDVRRFEEGLKRAKSGLSEMCDIWEDMKEQFSERGGASYRRRDDWDEEGEHRSRRMRDRYM